MQTITQADGPEIRQLGRSALKRANPVFLLKLAEDAIVETSDGTLNGMKGDFLAHDPISGHVWPVKASYVEQHYDFVELEIPVPETVKGESARFAYVLSNTLRRELKATGQRLDALRRDMISMSVDGEAKANATLAYRHLEDASLRLGKVLQALDGGVSVYDRSTTVGA